jgi:hypothetical protein
MQFIWYVCIKFRKIQVNESLSFNLGKTDGLPKISEDFEYHYNDYGDKDLQK